MTRAIAEQRRQARALELGAIASTRTLAVALVGCGRQKTASAQPARALYTGSLFRAALAHAQATADVVFVASALHGLLELDQVVEPYDYKLLAVEAPGWATSVVVDLEHALCGVPAQVTLLCGGLYASSLAEALAGEALEPLLGMTLGRRLAFFRVAALERSRAQARIGLKAAEWTRRCEQP